MTNNFSNILQKNLMNPMIHQIDTHESNIVAIPGAHRWAGDSPERFEIMKKSMTTSMPVGARLKSPSSIAHVAALAALPGRLATDSVR